MEEKNEIEFLRQKNNELIQELSEKMVENDILLKFKVILEHVLIDCKCKNDFKSIYSSDTVNLLKEYHILMDMQIKNKGIFCK